MGGGWNRIFVGEFPTYHAPVVVAAILRVPWNETNREIEIGLSLVSEDGEALDDPAPISGQMTIGRPPDARVGSDLLVPLAIRLPYLYFEEPSLIEVVLAIDGAELGRRQVWAQSRA